MGMQEYISSTHISSAWGLISKHLQCWLCIESRSFSHRIQNESNCCFGRMQRFIWNNSEIHHVENIWLLRINGIGGWPNIYQIFSNNLICSYYCPLRLTILQYNCHHGSHDAVISTQKYFLLLALIIYNLLKVLVWNNQLVDFIKSNPLLLFLLFSKVFLYFVFKTLSGNWF